MKQRQLEIPEDIWEDKHIDYESKRIYAYIYSKGYDKLLTHINVGELQQIIKITNKGLKKKLEILEKFKYLIYKEYSNGLYEIHIQ